jgi:DNA polymerase-3 subunit alpha
MFGMRWNNSDFVHLHCHTEFSRFDGLAKMPDFVMTARMMGFRSLAISDHGNVGGWIKFYQECNKKKGKNADGQECELLGPDGKPLPPIKPIFAEEFYLARNHERHEKKDQPDGRKGNRHILLIAKNAEGYKNLCRLSQRSWTHGQYIDPRIDLELLAAHSKGVICSSACLGSVVNANLYQGRRQQAEKVATLLKDIYGEDFYLAAMYHGIDAEGYILPDILALGRKLGIDVVAENDCHMVRKEQARSHELLMAISSSRCIKDPKRIHFPYDEFYLKSAEEMAQIFGAYPEVLQNTMKIAERVEDYLQTGGMRLPDFEPEKVLKSRTRVALDPQIVKEVKIPRHLPQVQLLEELSWEGMIRLGYDKSVPHVEAYKKELRDLGIALTNNDMDFFSYFLIDWDINRYARENNILTGCGRGSGFGSVILRTLGITYGPDPIEHNLFWERFLSFDDAYIMLDSDWGLKKGKKKADVDEIADGLDEARAVEDDMGGVDRY